MREEHGGEGRVTALEERRLQVTRKGWHRLEEDDEAKRCSRKRCEGREICGSRKGLGAAQPFSPQEIALNANIPPRSAPALSGRVVSLLAFILILGTPRCAVRLGLNGTGALESPHSAPLAHAAFSIAATRAYDGVVELQL